MLNPLYVVVTTCLLSLSGAANVGCPSYYNIPPIPQLVSATFSSQGSSLIAQFDSDVSASAIIGATSSFSCGILFTFPDASSVASCQFTSGTTAVAYLNGAINVKVDDYFGIRGGTITAKCPNDYPDCCIAYEAIPEQAVQIAAPEVVTSPVVVLPTRISASVCAPPSIDASMSYGSGGRAWTIAVVTVNTTSSTGPALKAFLESSDFLRKSVTIEDNSATLLEGGYTYEVTVELCNFLEACSSAKTVISVQSEPLPYVNIFGPGATSVAVFDTLRLSASASLPLCNNVLVPVSQLNFEWSVSQDGVPVSVVQTSRDKTRFVLPGYSLSSGNRYSVKVTVTNSQQLSQTSLSSVLVTVTPGPVVASIAGANSRLLPFNSPITLDGSGSYDRNVGATSSNNLDYTWSCRQTSPAVLTSCPFLSVGPSVNGVVSVSNNASIFSNYAYVVTLTATDSVDSARYSTREVALSLLAPAAPLVTLNRASTVAKINPQSSLRLEGSVELGSTETVTWSVDDALLQAALNAGTVLLTTRSQVLSAGTHRLAFVLRANVLTRGTRYTFTLTAGTSQASVSVLVNDPPRPGIFVVSPSTGTEISTPFEFSTNFWTDEDTPLEFEFGFISNGVRLVLQPRSRLTSLRTSLPAGRDTDGFQLRTYVRVFDALNAVQETTMSVTVNRAASTDDLLGDLEGSVSNAGTVSGLKKAVSLVTSVINSKECNSAPDCAALNRAACSSTANTCGGCMEGFFGDTGNHNSLCINAAELNTVLDVSVTYTCDACPVWHQCVAGICVPDQKECIDECSGSGVCQFIDSVSRFTISSCPLYDFSCSARCNCDSGFYGIDCSTTEAQLAQRSNLRSNVMEGLQNIAMSDNPSADAALSLISSLSAATDQASEISGDAANTVLTVANEILNGGQLGDLTTAQMTGLLSAMNAVLISSGMADPTRRKLSVSTARKNVVEALENYGLMLGESHLVAGQQSEFSETSTFRMSAQVFGAGSDALASLASAVEVATGSAGTTVSLDAAETDSELLMIVTAVESNLYTELDRPMASDGIRLTARGANVSKAFTFTISHKREMEYSVNKSGIFFETECRGKRTVDFICPNDGFVITHDCDGKNKGILRDECPGTKTVSVCQNLEDVDAVSACEVLDFNTTYTTCLCTMKPSGRRRRVLRGLQAGEDELGYLEIAAISESVSEDFVATTLEARNFDSLDEVQRVLVVIIMFSVMWVVGLGMTWYYAIRGATKDRRLELNEQMNLQRQIAAASTKTSVEKIKKYLDAYVNEVFPVVFRPSPWHERLITEIKKHHRYINIFTGGGDPRVRLMTTVHLLTVQTMLMFILAVFYDIQFPTDDGECDTLDMSNCEDEKSIFDTQQSKCNWNDVTGECEFVEPVIAEQMIVLISILVAVATAPINLVVDFIFDDILSAPTADSAKLNAEPNALQRAGKQLNAARRASVNAVRRASVSLQAAIPARRESKKMINTAATRMIPESTISAQSLANASVTEALGIFKESHQKYEDERKSILGHTTSKSMINTSRRTRQTRGAGAPAIEARNPVAINAMALPGTTMFGYSVDAQFAELSKEIIAQRRRLKPSEQEDFDIRWGFDPNGEFSRESALSNLCCRKSGPEAAIKKELEFVAKESAEKYEKLRLATDAHTGLEMLHLFVLDLLGRDTPAALIFSSKTSEDFRHAMIVSKTVKIVCWIVVLLLNFFFIFFAMLRGLERGQRWQTGYAVACVIQFVVEIFMFETIECIWVHYVIPDAASAEIYAAQYSLKRTINSLCSTMSANATYILDVPKYLFVSTNLAEKFPNMLESMIIRSYHYHLPGELQKKWHVNTDRDSVIVRFLRNFSIFAMTISILQWVGSSPSSLQRAVIHTVNPLLFGGIIILLLFLFNNPIYLTVVAGLVFYKLLQYGVRQLIKYRAEHRPKKFERMVSNVVPIPNTVDRDTGSAGSARSINSIAVVPLPHIGTVNEEEQANASSNSDEDSDNRDGPAETEMISQNFSGTM